MPAPDAPSGAHVAAPRRDAARPTPLPASSGALALGLEAPGDLVDSGVAGTIRFTPSERTQKPVVQRYLQDPAFRQLGFDLREETGGLDLTEANTAKLLGAPIVREDVKAFVTDIMLGESGLQFAARSPEGFMRALGKGGVGRDVVDLLLAKLAAPSRRPELLGAYAAGRAERAEAPSGPTDPSVVPLLPLDRVPAAISPKLVSAINAMTDRLVTALATGEANVAFSVPAILSSLNALLVGTTPETIRSAVLTPLGLGDMAPEAFVRELQSMRAYLGNLAGVQAAAAVFAKGEDALKPAFKASVEQGLDAVVGNLAGDVGAATAALNAEIAKKTEVKDSSGKVLIPGMTDLVSPNMVQNSDVISVATLTTQGEWVSKFKKTVAATFNGPKGPAEVTLMTDTREAKVAELPGALAVRLPLKSGLEYEIAVPKGTTTEVRVAALPLLAASAPPRDYQFAERQVRLAIPRTKVTNDFDPLAALRKVGIDPSLLDLAGVTGDPSLKLTEGAARTTSVRDENGGSTSSAVAMGATRSASLPLAITADVPHTVRLRAPNGLVLVAEVITDGAGLDPGPAA